MTILSDLAAAVAAWTRAGTTVRYFVLTRGGTGIDTTDRVDAVPHARVARAVLLRG